MPKHKVDKLGLPTDPEMRKLELRLCDLAGIWRCRCGGSQQEQQIMKEYHTTVKELYRLGWDGCIDVECHLPQNLMPEEYKERHPYVPMNWFSKPKDAL